MHKINVNESYSAPRNTAISNLAEYANKQKIFHYGVKNYEWT